MTEKTVKEVEVKPVAKLEEEGDIAADYLEALLDIADLDGDIDIDVENNRASVAIVGAKLDNLVGRDGEVLDALQELTRLAVQSSTTPASIAALAFASCAVFIDATITKSKLCDISSSALLQITASGKSDFACATRSGFPVWIATISKPAYLANGAWKTRPARP